MVHVYLTYYHHAELLDAPYTIMLFWFILQHWNTNSNNLVLKWNLYTFELTPGRQN